jgi:murein DD-endopeptidase MepM/ murein hydrolase activator NlpD
VRYLVSFIFLFSSLIALNADISSSTVENGRTVLVEFDKNKTIEYKNIVLDKKRFQFFDHPLNKNKVYALVPMSYYEKPSTKKLKINYTKKGIDTVGFISLKVKDAKYKKEEITVSSSKVNPQSKKVKERISKEYNEAMKIYGTLTPKSYIKSEFIMPLDSFITSDFGKARVYNGSLKGYHSGTDFRAKVGTPLIASNDGVVALAKDRFYSGGTVLINHGQGIYTCYFHMSDFAVKKGDVVKKGQKIGLSGQSGRVTGPHLHFAVRINKVQVDPLQFVELMNKNIFKKKTKEI